MASPSWGRWLVVSMLGITQQGHARRTDRQTDGRTDGQTDKTDGQKMTKILVDSEKLEDKIAII